jgi:biopolymer transport protein ExbB/TolQ
MNILSLAENFLFVVSEVLHYPVMLGLVALVFFMLVLMGATAREFLERKKQSFPLRADYSSKVAQIMAKPGVSHEIELEKLLQDYEQRGLKPVEKARFIVRAGPGVGLMGTLIPMGVGLAALAQGEMPEMASQMVHAFTAAVVGLGSGVAAYAIAIVREQWLREDLIEMRYLTEKAARGEWHGAQSPSHPLPEQIVDEGRI